jgi:hypothetical protein
MQTDKKKAQNLFPFLFAIFLTGTILMPLIGILKIRQIFRIILPFSDPNFPPVTTLLF